MCLIQKERADFQIGKAHVALRRVVHGLEKLQCDFCDALFLLLQYVPLPIVITGSKLGNCLLDPCKLPVHMIKHYMLGKGNHLKATVRHDDPVIVALFDLPEHLLTHSRFEAFRFNCHYLCFRIQLRKNLLPLADNMIGNDKQVFTRESILPQFHCRGNHDISFAGSDVKCKQCVLVLQDSLNSVFLIWI